MKRLSLQWISLTAAAAVLAAGCAAGPNRAPERNNAGNNVSTTTGDADACAVALGNTVAPGGTMNVVDRVGAAVGPAAGTAGGHEATANGVIIGNVALVALPTADALPTTPPAGAVPGVPVTPTAPAAGTTGAAPGATGAATVGAPGTRTTADTVIPGTRGAPAPITGAAAPPNPVVTAPAPAGNPAAQGAPGGVQDNRYNAPARVGAALTAQGDADAVERIKVACDKLADIRVVHSADDRVRLAQITASIRTGQPITDFMTDLTRMTQAATSVGGGRNANRGPGAPAAVPGTPGAAAPPATAPAAPGTP